MKIVLTLALTITLILTGCGKKEEPGHGSMSSSEEQTATASAPIFQTTPNPNDPLLDIDGTIITKGEVSEIVRREAGSAAGQPNIPMEHITARVVNTIVATTLLSNEAKRNKINVTIEDVKGEFEKNPTQFPPGLTFETVMQHPELQAEMIRTMTIDRLVKMKITNSFEIAEQEIDSFLGEHKDDISKIPETVRARHLLISVGADDDATAKAAKKKKIEDIRKQLEEGADFGTLTKLHSDCPSGQFGGELGTFKRGTMVPPFDKAAFSQEVDELGPVVETTEGYHVIQVLEHNKAGFMPRQRVEVRLRRQKWFDALQGYVSELEKKAVIKRF